MRSARDSGEDRSRTTPPTLVTRRVTSLHPDAATQERSSRGEAVKKIQVRKTETVRLTSAAQPLYVGGCGGTAPVLA
ncbi:hypothetical protein GCM10023223_19700 [Stackebrandtia albiflava]